MRLVIIMIIITTHKKPNKKQKKKNVGLVIVKTYRPSSAPIKPVMLLLLLQGAEQMIKCVVYVARYYNVGSNEMENKRKNNTNIKKDARLLNVYDL